MSILSIVVQNDGRLKKKTQKTNTYLDLSKKLRDRQDQMTYLIPNVILDRNKFHLVDQTIMVIPRRY